MTKRYMVKCPVIRDTDDGAVEGAYHIMRETGEVTLCGLNTFGSNWGAESGPYKDVDDIPNPCGRCRRSALKHAKPPNTGEG